MTALVACRSLRSHWLFVTALSKLAFPGLCLQTARSILGLLATVVPQHGGGSIIDMLGQPANMRRGHSRVAGSLQLEHDSLESSAGNSDEFGQLDQERCRLVIAKLVVELFVSDIQVGADVGFFLEEAQLADIVGFAVGFA